MPLKGLAQAAEYLRAGIRTRGRIGEQSNADAAKLTASLAEAWLQLAADKQTQAETGPKGPQQVQQTFAKVRQLTERAHHARSMARVEPDPARKKTLVDYARHMEREASALIDSDESIELPLPDKGDAETR
jgi:hypothetical protein